MKPSPKSIHIPEQLQKNPKWKQLVDLFEWCTMPEPHQRPSAKEVLDACETVKKGGKVEFKRVEEDRLEDKLERLKMEARLALDKNDMKLVSTILKQIESLEAQGNDDKA